MDLVKNYLHSRQDSPASSVSRRSISESFHTADEYFVRQPPPRHGQPNPAAPPMPYTPHTLGHGHHNPLTPRSPFTPHRPLPVGRRRSDDWIHSRLRTPIAGTPGADGFTPNWLMNALPQIKIEIFKGDPKEWPTFISSFRDMIHNVVPSDAQRHAFLKQLLTPEVRSYIAEYLEDPSTYYEALEELKKRYGQPQVVARSHLMALMNLPTVKDDDPHALAKLNRTLHGAMHALRTGGYEQDLDSGMTLEHVVSRLPQRMRSTWGVKVYRMAPNRATL